MGSNIQNYNFNKIEAHLSNSQYYDFYLAQDGLASHGMYDGIIDGDCLVVHIDFNEPGIFSTGTTSADTIYSLVTWTGATNTGHTLTTFGFTGIDNGYIQYVKQSGDTANTGLTQTLTGTTIEIPSGDTRFVFNAVSGSTGNFLYEKTFNERVGVRGSYIDLCGGFYQGYFKLDGYDYEVLPTRVPKAWVAEFWLNKTLTGTTCDVVTGTTLNDTYPNNEGFFFYMGTRAENKFWNFFGENTGCTTFCTSVKEDEIVITGDNNFPVTLHPALFKVTEVTNQFLIYGRSTGDDKATCGDCGAPASGLGTKTVCTYDEGNSVFVTTSTFTKTFDTNPFLIYGRSTGDDKATCGDCGAPASGYGTETVCTYTGITSDYDFELDPKIDVIDNALGFRIKDDGSIGYRALKLTGTCENDVYTSGITVEEQYSISGTVTPDEWEHIAIRFVMGEEYDECDLANKDPRTGRLMFYVNSKLKFVAEDVDELVFKRLNEYKDKQLGVPYNYSLGGGSQGLLESMTFDGQDPDDLGLAIETNFAGTFIGGISQFRFYICDLNWCDITNNYMVEMDRYEGEDPGIFTFPFNNVFI
tara:strand:+ start:74105 stop:75856 length:1752 start_codon:yes stop_codon:yes gene_type:complete